MTDRPRPTRKIVVCYSSGRSGSTNLATTLCKIPGVVAIDEVLIGLLYGDIGQAVLKERLEFETVKQYGGDQPDLSFLDECHAIDIIDQYVEWLEGYIGKEITHVFIKINAQQLMKAVNSKAEFEDRVLYINIKRNIVDIVASRIMAEYISHKAGKMFGYDLGADRLMVEMSEEEKKLLSRVVSIDDPDLTEIFWDAGNLINVEIMVVQMGQYLQKYYKAHEMRFSDMIEGKALEGLYEYVGLEGDNLPTELVKERVVKDTIKVPELRKRIMDSHYIQEFYMEG